MNNDSFHRTHSRDALTHPCPVAPIIPVPPAARPRRLVGACHAASEHAARQGLVGEGQPSLDVQAMVGVIVSSDGMALEQRNVQLRSATGAAHSLPLPGPMCSPRTAQTSLPAVDHAAHKLSLRLLQLQRPLTGTQCHGASGRSSSSLALSMAASTCMTMGLSPVILAGISTEITRKTE